MPLVLNPDRIKRYKDILKLIIKYARKDFSTSTEFENRLSKENLENGQSVKERAANFASDLESLGPTFIKLGQLLSTRADFLPGEYLDALSRLQDKVEPFSFEEVENTIQSELNVRISKAFLEFEKEPIAAASLGQVHFAVLRNGKQAAVKVQRPNIVSIITKDLEALEEIANSLEDYTEAGKRYGVKNILHEFRKSLINELDYEQEADNLSKLGKNLSKYGRIIIPKPTLDYTSKRVLTMDFVTGTKVTKISPLTRLELDGRELAEELFEAYLDQVLADGFFHADPHPGNVFITGDKKLALIDLGMVASVDAETRENLLKLLLFISEGRGRDAAKLTLKMGVSTEDGNVEKYIQEVSSFISEYNDSKIENIKVGKVVVDLSRIAAGNGIRIPSEFTMLGKTLLHLDEIAKILDPDFNPNKQIRNHAEQMMRKHMMKSISPGNIFSSVLEINELIQKLPGRLNNLMDSIANNKLELKVKAFDDIELMHSIQKVANRITLGLVLAALIIGAALMMQIKTEFTIFGYSGLAIIFFLIAAITGMGLVISIFFSDKWGKRKKSK